MDYISNIIAIVIYLYLSGVYLATLILPFLIYVTPKKEVTEKAIVWLILATFMSWFSVYKYQRYIKNRINQ